MVMGSVRVVRTILDAAKQENELCGTANLILKCCADFLLSAFDFVNKFTINFVAITGEGYCSSAKMTYELLKRNLLSAVVVETVSTRLLVGTTFVICSLYAILVSIVIPSFLFLFFLLGGGGWDQVDLTFKNKLTVLFFKGKSPHYKQERVESSSLYFRGEAQRAALVDIMLVSSHYVWLGASCKLSQGFEFLVATSTTRKLEHLFC
jgi:Plasma-membrane choline transporter